MGFDLVAVAEQVVAGVIVVAIALAMNILVSRAYEKRKERSESEKERPVIGLPHTNPALFGGSFGAGIFQGWQVAAGQHCSCTSGLSPVVAFLSIYLGPLPFAIGIGLLLFWTLSRFQRFIERRGIRNRVNDIAKQVP